MAAMPPPKGTWDRLPGWYADALRKYEADLPRIEAETARMPRLTLEQVEQLRYLLYGTPTGGQ